MVRPGHGNMSRLRILHVVTRSQRRGAEVVALELARQLDALGHDDRVVALAPAFDGSRVDELPPLVDRPGLGVRATGALRRALRDELERRPVDLVLAHGGQPFQIAASARRGSRPFVVWQRILPFPAAIWSQPRRFRWQRIARRADAAVVLTEDLEVELRRLGFGGPVWAIQNFRDATPFADLDRNAAAAALRAELGLGLDARIVGFLGHLIEQKRPERALDVLALVHAQGERAHLVVAGDGPRRADFERDASASGLGEFVHVLGDRRDVDVLLGGIDVLISTSASEGVPGVLIEALMAGCPVVAMLVGGIATVVDDGTTGILVGSGDSGALADQVVQLLRDPSRRERMTAAARLRSAEFSATNAARLYEQRFESLLAGSQTT